MSKRRETSQKILLMFVVYWVLLLTASVSSSTGTSLGFKEGALGHAEGTLSKYYTHTQVQLLGREFLTSSGFERATLVIAF